MASQFEQLERVIGVSKSVVSAAEVHGFSAGWIASGSQWQTAGPSFFESSDIELEGDLAEFLNEVADDIAAGLADEDFAFQILLPEDRLGINQRREALSEWCQGFLAGFGLTGRFQDAELSEEVKELLKDFGQIAQVEEELPEDDENESDLTEITEYVRMGAIMCFTDCATKAVH